LVEYQLNKT